jgi:hypothetical protein
MQQSDCGGQKKSLKPVLGGKVEARRKMRSEVATTATTLVGQLQE